VSSVSATDARQTDSPACCQKLPCTVYKVRFWVILCWVRPAGLFVNPDTLTGAAPYGEDLTVVVVGGGERQPVSNPLESVQRKAAVLRTPEVPMAFSVRQWSASAVVTPQQDIYTMGGLKSDACRVALAGRGGWAQMRLGLRGLCRSGATPTVHGSQPFWIRQSDLLLLLPLDYSLLSLL
jgi:hypothetical protein